MGLGLICWARPGVMVSAPYPGATCPNNLMTGHHFNPGPPVKPLEVLLLLTNLLAFLLLLLLLAPPPGT